MLETHYQLTDQGHAFENGSSVFLAQVKEKSSGELLHPNRIESIQYSVYRLDHSDPAVKAAIPGHTEVPLVVEEVFFETPVLDGLWNGDTVGYNSNCKRLRQEFLVEGLYFTPILIRRESGGSSIFGRRLCPWSRLKTI